MEYRVINISKMGFELKELEKSYFEEVKFAKDNIFQILDIEEKFNMLLENYYEFEKHRLDTILKHSFNRNTNWSYFRNITYQSNRRLLNLLSTCKLYIDQIMHNISSLKIDDEKIKVISKGIKEKLKDEYNTCKGYRIMCELRNYLQHRNLPIHSILMSTSRKDVENDIFLERTLNLTLKVELIKFDKKVNPSIIAELSEIGDHVEISTFVREYLNSLGKIHKYLRNEFTEEVNEIKIIIMNSLDSFKESLDVKNVVLSFFHNNIDEQFYDTFDLSFDAIERYNMLIKKNRNIENFNKMIITNQN